MKKIKDFFMSDKFWKTLSDMHLYDTKGEGAFKAFVISFSWAGSIWMTGCSSPMTRELGAAFHLFSLALIMEYVIKIIKFKNFAPKFFPLILCGLSAYIFVITTPAIFNGYLICEYGTLLSCTQILIGVIWFDVVLQLVLERSTDEIENTIKNIPIRRP